jgi:tRNA pseudouridine38-40 synthase
MRIVLGIEYDGTDYVGWQRQKSGTGVQEVLERAIAAVANEPVRVVCAGRTDAGVHAIGQVVHFDTSAKRTDRGWLLGTNTHLPADINVRYATAASDDFHARFSATSRTYVYAILNQAVRSAISRRHTWWVHEELDAERMHAAAQQLIGRHDFSAFRASGCQASTPVREVRDLSVVAHGNLVVITITANAFLQHMVRNIAGTLVAIGRRDALPDSLCTVLRDADRSKAGITAPAQGLTLVDVSYPDSFGVPVGIRDSLPVYVYDSPL